MKQMMSEWVMNLQQDLGVLTEVFSTRAGSTPALLPGERRTVAVLFTDLKGFTSMSEKLDHEIVHSIMSGVMGGLSRLVEFHGGYVDKFEGDRIMALFGAEKAHENDCVRAVSCAVKMIDMVQEFASVLRDRGFSIDARSGVSYGDVTVAPDPSGHMTATGDEVNIASRLEETAETGSVQVTEAVRNTAGGLFEWEDLGLVSVKGKKEAVHAFRPTGPGIAQIERWERAKRLASVPFVGRKNELAELEKLLQMQSGAATKYNRRGGAKHIFIGIQGVAGIGKSRLIFELRKSIEARSDRTLVLKAGCASYAQPSLLLILAMIRNRLAIVSTEYPSEETLRSRLESLLRDSDAGGRIREDSIDILVSLLSSRSGNLQFSSTDELEDDTRLQVLSSIADLMRVLSDNSDRLVVILDDIHWIDSSSREVIEFLATNCDTRLPILFILIYRPEPALGIDMIGGLSEEYTSTLEIILEEIDPESSRELIRYLLGTGDSSEPAISGDIIDYLLESSGRNAFFIEELVLGLIETGLLELDTDRGWMLNASPESIVIPQSIKGLIRARTDQLPSEPRRLLQIASVLGEQFDPRVLFQVADNTGMDDNPDESFRELIERGFLEPDNENPSLFGFEHVLARDAVYETILRRNRRFLHSLCADTLIELEQQNPDLASVIALHRADAGQTGKAIPWGKRALDLAAERYDRDAVLFWSERLENWIRARLDSADDAMLLIEVLRKRQTIEGLRLERQAQHATLEKIDSLITEWNLSDMRAGYLMSVGSMHRNADDLSEALEKFEQAIELFRESEDRSGIARATSAIAMCNKQMGRLEQAAEELAYSISLFRELGETQNIAIALVRFASTMHLLGRYDDGLEILGEALQLAREECIKTVEADILSQRGVLQHLLRQHEQALQSQQDALTISREVGYRYGELSALNSMCNVLNRIPRFDEARRIGLEALKASRELGVRRTEANVLCGLGLTELGDSRYQEAYDYFGESLEAHRRIRNRPGQAAVLWNLGLAAFDLLRFEDGVEYCRKSMELYKEIGNRKRVSVKLLIQSITLTEMGRVNEALACLEEYESDYIDLDDSFARLRVSCARADIALRKGELKKAEDFYNRTLEIAREMNVNELVAKSLQNIGMIRLEQGRPEEARDYLQRGFEALDGSEYLETFIACAEYLLMAGRNEDAIHFARKAYSRASAAGNMKTKKRSLEILEELGENVRKEIKSI
ncbi:MAG: tetratricopeptide repeat protein [Candidatus Aegiribacteria sp.]|nr:tetratricopeptide repeat protein [Candidatus Aegiribacteria sp.]